MHHVSEILLIISRRNVIIKLNLNYAQYDGHNATQYLSNHNIFVAF